VIVHHPQSSRLRTSSFLRSSEGGEICGGSYALGGARGSGGVGIFGSGGERGPHSGLLGGNCPSGGTQVFAAWQDFANYNLAPNGGFEFGTTGWLLSGGAKVVDGNEPFFPTGTHSLSLPSGSSALSPVVCLGPKQLYVRMFAADAAGSDSGLRVRVVWYGLLNKALGISDYAAFEPGHDWSPTSKLNSSGGMQVRSCRYRLDVCARRSDAARGGQQLADRRPLHRSLHRQLSSAERSF
jgi:hypothetical protein